MSNNIIDRAIEFVSPQTALRRARARAVLALSGGYIAGKRSRPALANFNPGISDADGDTNADLETMRGRSRDLARNDPIATGALNTVVTNVVGTGLSMKPGIDHSLLGLTEEQAAQWQAHVSNEWKLWSENRDCDITRTQNFYELQALAFRSALESGDLFVLTPMPSDRKPYRTTVQLVEADRISTPLGKQTSANMSEGVELDASGAPLAYHICTTHPGARATKREWKRVPVFNENNRRQVIHLMERRRPGQTRGVPYLAPVIEQLKQVSRYTEAELQAAVISAAFAVFIRMDSEAFGELFRDEADQKTYIQNAMGWDGGIPQADIGSPGKAINLLPGESVESPDLGRPNDKFDPFVQAMLRQIGVALELPFEVLIKHFTASYSAARAALLDAWRFFRRRRDWLASGFCQPIYEIWLEEGVLTGRINAPGYFADPALRYAWSRAVWVGDGPGSIDPEKEVNAAIKRYELGITTLETESILHDGVDWESKHRQQVKEKRMRAEAGLGVEPATPAAPQPDNHLNDEEEAETRNALLHAVERISAMQPIVNITQGDVHVAPPQVNVHPANMEFKAGDTHVSLPEGCIQLEANISTPQVNVGDVVVDVPAPQVTIAQPQATQDEIERDPQTSEITRITRRVIREE